MKISLIAMGTRMPTWVIAGYQEYAKRITNEYQLQLLEIPTIKRTAGANIANVMQQEAEKMLAAIPQGDYVVALTERGQLWDTKTVSKQIQYWHNLGINISLLIGGPDGLAPSCFTRAKQQWSLSPLTLPHPLVRVVVAEQIYRAISLLKNHPYHR
jgi:23S rRNA (pseudouridine1915-N3)-methyltransferase